MIYKSVRDAIKAYEGGKLFCLRPLYFGEETPRAIFVSADVSAVVEGPWAETSEGRRHASLRSLFDAFTEGDRFTMALDPFRKPSSTMIARVAPVEMGVCDFRCLDPNPGIRAFGCFAEQDVFVALTWNYRENLKNGGDWNAEVSECKQRWQELFGALSPHQGMNVDDYVSYNIQSV